ncbi:MAG TPA: ABC transporter ATP-binding protein, partial [Bacillota bacterium]|nr:ABC transporter ATP-binding protein [Bacillota bacterium]
MLELNGISKVYGQGASQVEALRDVDLNISPGEFVAVMGTSGCGKTTLLNIIGCLDTATSGIYTLQGKDVSRLSLKDKARVRNKTFGFVFQAFNLLAEYTVLENVTLPLRYSGVPKRRWKEQGLGVLERLGIADLSSRYPDQLSGGQQQRVAIARALVNDPEIIIADEP